MLRGRATKRWQHLFENYFHLFHGHISFQKATPTELSHVVICLIEQKAPFLCHEMNTVTAVDTMELQKMFTSNEDFPSF